MQFADPKLLRDAFRYSQIAKVDKVGCLKFHGQVYEAGFAFVGRKVEILYTPESLDVIEVLCKGIAPVTARRLAIGPSCGPREKLPSVGKIPTQTSRLLDAAAKKQQARQSVRHTAISFANLVGGVTEDVP